MSAPFFRPISGDGHEWVTLDVTPSPLISRWDCPPRDVRPDPVALSVELGRSASTVVLVEGARGYPDTFGAAWARDICLWPLPPPGPLRLVCAWPDRGIPETSTTIDAGPLRDAAARARPEWPADPADR